MQTSKRIYGLDILRASAILLVLIYHCRKQLNWHIGDRFFYALPDGVTLFFVLSGFLVGGILIRTFHGGGSWLARLVNFWRNRWLRTLPAYYCILLLLVLHRVVTHSAESADHYLKYIFFVQNISTANLYFFSESWSLAVEEWFYLLMPVLMFISLRWKNASIKNGLLLWIFIILSVSLLLREWRIASAPLSTYNEWNNLVRKPVIMRMDSIMLGFAGAWLLYYYPASWKRDRRWYWAGLLLIFLPSGFYLVDGYNWFTIHARIPCESIGTLLLLPVLSGIESGKGVLYRGLTFISLISYSIYLVNFTPYSEWVLPRMGKIGIHLSEKNVAHSILLVILFLLWTFIAAWLLYRLIERPFMQMRKRGPVHKTTG